MLFDANFRSRAHLPLIGLPIRTRVSPDFRWGAATVFVTGESYAGDFTTRTTIIDLTRGEAIGDLEQFTTERDGKPFKAVDFNFWGVTFFANGDRFLRDAWYRWPEVSRRRGHCPPPHDGAGARC